jgi:hypothetical protein
MNNLYGKGREETIHQPQRCLAIMNDHEQTISYMVRNLKHLPSIFFERKEFKRACICKRKNVIFLCESKRIRQTKLALHQPKQKRTPSITDQKEEKRRDKELHKKNTSPEYHKRVRTRSLMSFFTVSFVLFPGIERLFFRDSNSLDSRSRRSRRARLLTFARAANDSIFVFRLFSFPFGDKRQRVYN